MSVEIEAATNTYLPPVLMQRSHDQAALFLVGHAWIGDAGARDLLELLFLEPSQQW